jgi:response regulator RpfG family c-di-GMP phosphodiesterase
MEDKQKQEAENLAGEVYEACGKYLDTLSDIYKIFYGAANLDNEESSCYKDEFLQRLMKTFKRKLTRLRKVYEEIQKSYWKIKNGGNGEISDYVDRIIENSKTITVSLSFDYFIFLAETIYKNVSKCAKEHRINLQQSRDAIMKTGSSLIRAVEKLLSYKAKQDEKGTDTIERNKR